MWGGLPPPDHQYPLQNDVNKIAIKQPQTHHRHGPIFRKQGKRETKKWLVKLSTSYYSFTIPFWVVIFIFCGNIVY